MKASREVLALFILISLIPSCLEYAQCADSSSRPDQVPLWLILHFRDYGTDMPVANISVSATVRIERREDGGWVEEWRTVESARTNETGYIQVFIGNTGEAISFEEKSLRQLELSDNYTLIKVQSILVEDPSWSTRRYEAEYISNFTMHEGLQIDLDYRDLGDRRLIEGNIWVLKGRLVRVSDSHPFTGQKANLFTVPAIKTDMESKQSEYETLYFSPLSYDVTMFHEVRSWAEYEERVASLTEQARRSADNSAWPFAPLTVRVDQDTALINWMSHAAEEYAGRQMSQVKREMDWLGSSGYALDRENEAYAAVESLLGRVLRLYRNEEFGAAVGGAKITYAKLVDLTKWFANLKTLAVATTVGIGLFAYGIASLLSSFVLEESPRKIRVASKLLVFSAFMLVFSLTHPSLRMTFMFILGSRSIGLPMTLLGCFIVSGAIYFFIQLLSVRRKTMTDLSVQLGVRSLKRRRSRTILTLTTITLMVSSAIIFVNITMGQSTTVSRQWKGTDTLGVLVEPDTYSAPISEYDVNWTRTQEWCKELSYREGIRFNETRNVFYINRQGVLSLGEQTAPVNIVGIEPAFFEKYYGMSGLIRGPWSEFKIAEPVAIVPTTLGILIREEATLSIRETITTGGPVPPIIRTIPLGEFRVVGTFDPQTAFANLIELDNTALFEKPSTMVLVPLKSAADPVITISEVTILINEGYEPMDVAEELAYTLTAATVANRDGVARRIEWALQLSVEGLIPYLPPLVIAGLMMYTTMASVYEERRREFTTMATLGLDPKNTFRVFLVEALLLGLMGTFIGFFGSYILGGILHYVSSFLGLPVFLLSFSHWSMLSILVALLTGVVMVFLGGYIPAVRTQDLSLMGRVKRREMVGEFISEKGVTTFSLPIRETVQNSEMLYSYVRETMGKFKSSIVDHRTIKGEMYRDGTFRVSFTAVGEGRVTVPCELRGVREEEILIPTIEFPTSYQHYERMRSIIRDLEEYMIGFSAWKEMQLKMQIVREAPKKRKTTEQILAEIKAVIDEINDCNKKLRILEGQRAKLSEEVYDEFKQKYVDIIEGKSKNLRSMTVNLEPHHKELNGEIDKIAVEVERITTSYNLGEISEEEYVKTCGPLQARLAELRGRVQELEEIFQFLKKPLTMTYD